MKFTSAEIDRRLQFFTELLSYEANCYLWTYSGDGTLLSTNCPHLVLDTVFRHGSLHDYMMNHAKRSHSPLMLSNEHGMVWGAVFEQDGDQLERIHLLGPSFTCVMNNAEIEKAVWGKINPRWKPKYIKIMETIPVISSVMFTHRILMMQYCLTGERINTSDIVMQFGQNISDAKGRANSGIYSDRIQIHMAEQTLLSMIRNGDINYQSALSNASRVFTGRGQLSGDPLQNAKLGQVQFIALCCNAAIEGGLSAETSYNRKDSYVRDVGQAKSITEVTQIGKTMYEDYVQLIYNQRMNQYYCKAVQSTCEYIENHLEENLTAELLAKRVGYSDYYLSRLFKKETGFSMDEYIRNARIERAKILLASSKTDIQDIAESLGFSGRNYFAVTFKKVTGMPPAAYRKKFQKL